MRNGAYTASLGYRWLLQARHTTSHYKIIIWGQPSLRSPPVPQLHVTERSGANTQLWGPPHCPTLTPPPPQQLHRWETFRLRQKKLPGGILFPQFSKQKRHLKKWQARINNVSFKSSYDFSDSLHGLRWILRWVIEQSLRLGLSCPLHLCTSTQSQPFTPQQRSKSPLFRKTLAVEGNRGRRMESEGTNCTGNGTYQSFLGDARALDEIIHMCATCLAWQSERQYQVS